MHARLKYLLPSSKLGKNDVILCVENYLSAHAGNCKNKY